MTAERRTSPMLLLAGVLWLVLLAWMSIALAGPPAAVPQTAPAEVFSAERAMKHVREIARAPHPVGSAEHGRVRDYLLQELSALDLAPSVQEASAVSFSAGTAATIQNILARKKGLEAGPAVLLAAHYDTVMPAPGAGDDGAGVAVLLETARALRSGLPLRNDVIFLFADGEELGHLGARAFVAEHPWKNDAGVVFNFDGFGTSGPAHLFEVSDENGWLVREFARSAPSPRASTRFDLARVLSPSRTDFIIFREAGIPGFDFRFLGSPENYHMPTDSPAALDIRTLQQFGGYALSLAKRLGNLELHDIRGDDVVCFNALGSIMVVYPVTWTRPIGIGVFLFSLLVAVLGVRRCGLSVVALTWGAFALVLALFVAACVAGALGRYSRLWGPLWQSRGGLYGLGLASMVLGTTTAIWALLLRRVTWQSLSVAGLGAWSGLALIVSFRAPEVSYLLVWPALAGSLATGALLLFPQKTVMAHSLIAGFGVVPGALLCAMVLKQILFREGLAGGGGLRFAILSAQLVFLLAPFLFNARARDAGLVAGVAVVTGLMFIIWDGFSVKYQARERAHGTIYYALDADTGEALWLKDSGQALDVTSDTFVSSALDRRREYARASLAGGHVVMDYATLGRKGAFLVSQAPPLALTPPSARLLEAGSKKEDRRTYHLLFTSPRSPAGVRIEIRGAPVFAFTFNGKKVERNFTLAAGARGDPAALKWAFTYVNLPASGIEISVETSINFPLVVQVADYSEGLSADWEHIPAPDKGLRRSSADFTIVVKTFKF